MRGIRLVPIIATACLFLGPARRAEATAFVVASTVDLSAVVIENITPGGHAGNRIRFSADFAGIDDFLVTDTLHLTVSFANGAAIHLFDTDAPFLGDDERLIGRTIVQFGFRGSDRHDAYQFTGVQGSLLFNPILTDNFTNDLNLTDTTFAFSGLELHLTFDNPVFDPDVPIFSRLVGFSFELWADAVEVHSPAAIPEPSTLALVAVGLAAARTRRRW
jgi:PEP-CTERM motif